MRLSNPNHVESLIQIGEAQIEVIPGKNVPKYFHLSIFAFHRPAFLTEIQKDETGLPWYQRAQR